MTSLSRQLAGVRESVVSAKASYQGRASLFLSSSDAAGLDFEVVLEAAVNGLSALRQYDERFGDYMDTLFYPNSVSVQRELKTAEENKEIDKEIRGLLKLLSLYATEPSSHKVLEYLFQRYRINELNVDALMSNMIHIHDTKIFARIVQLCEVKLGGKGKGSNSKDATAADGVWAFLDEVKRSGIPLQRVVLVKRMKRDNELFGAVCKLAKNAVKLVSKRGIYRHSTSVAGADRVLSFFATVMTEFTSEGELGDAQMRTLTPILHAGLTAPRSALMAVEEDDDEEEFGGRIHISAQWRRAVLMVLAQVSQKTALAQAFSKTFMGLLAMSYLHSVGSGRAAEAAEVALSLAVYVKNQGIKYIPAKVLHTLFVERPSGGGTANPAEDDEGDIVVDRRGTILPGSQDDDDDDEEGEGSRPSSGGAGEGATIHTHFFEMLKQMSTAYETKEIVHAIVSTLTSMLLAQNQASSAASEDDAASGTIDAAGASQLLVSFLTHGLVAEAGVEAIVAKILQSSSEPPAPEAAEKSSKKGKKQQKKNNNKSAGGSNNNEEPVLAVVRCIVQKYASLFDRLVDTALRAAQAEGEEEEEESEALRAFLRRALVDAPYRAPMDTGTTMLLSLMHVSPTTRVQALETFAERVPDKKPELSTVDEDGGILFVEEGKTLADYQDQTPDDLVDILGAVRDCMVDQDPRVAQAAWSAAVVKRVAIFASYGDFVKTIVRAVEAWVTASTAQPKDSEAVLCAILRGLGGHAVLEVLNKAQPGWAVASSTTAEAGWAVMPPINPLLPLDTQTPVPAHSLQVPEWLCMTVLGLSMGGRVASEEVQLTASQLGRDLGAAAYVHLLAELPIKSALTKAEDSTARTELIAVAMAKGISSGAGAADIMAITKVSQAVETLQHIVLYLLARLQQLDATSSISGAHLLTGELPAMRSLLNVVLRTVDILVDGELDEAEAAKASKSKKGGGAKQKGGERDSRRTSLGVSTSSVSAVRQVLPAVAMLLAYLADECATSAALSAEACSLLERVVNQARTAGFALFEKFRPVLPAAETGKLSSYLSSDSVAFPAFAPLLQGRAVAAGTGADGMDVEEDEDDEDGDGPRALVDHLGCRLLLVALGSAKESLVTLTHTILATFFEDCAVEAVLSACLSEHTPSNARAGALFVLGEYVGTLQQQGKTAVAASSAARFMAIQTACALAVCSANALERGGAIHVCQQLEKLPKTLKLTALSDKTAPLVSTEDLIYFGAKVAALADTAAIDGSAAFAAFTTRVMGPCGHGASKTAITTHGRVQSQILYAAVTCTTVSPTRASVLVKAAASTPLSVAWPYLQRVAEQLPSGDDGAALSKALLDTIAGPSALNGDDGDKTAAGVVEWLCRNIEGRPGASGELFRTQSVQLLAGGWASRCLGDGTATAKLHTQLFQAVMTEQVARPGHQGVLLAIAAIDVDTASIVEAVKERTAALETASGGASLAAPLQNLTSVLEAVTPKLQAPHREGEGEDEEVADLSRLLTLSLGALNRVVGSELGSVMGIDYCRSLLMDMGSHCLARIPRSVLTNGGGGGGKAGKGKKASGGAKGAGMYTTARVEGDVEAVLSAMQQARSSHAQASAMRLVRALAALQLSCVPACIRALGALLSTAAMDAPGGINTSSGDGSATEGGSKTNPQLGVVGGVLGSLVTLMVTSNDDTSAAVHPQEILIPLCTHFDAMGPSRKSALIKTALQAVGAHALPATVNVLLLHALTAFESEQRAAAEAREASINDITTTTSENETAGFVLLSRNAQRQARRSLQASAAEEYFRIASEASSRMPATAQVYSLVASVQAAAAFLEATVSPKSLSSAAVISVAGASGADNSSPFSLDVAALHAHHLAQGGDKSEQRARGVAAALSLMNLEHVFSVVENPSFHKQVVRAIDASPESAQRVQEQFVVIFDHLLQLIAAASALADGEDEDEEEGETVTVMFGAEAMEVSLASLGRTVNDWCLDVLKSMHRLLDTAAFVSILQELVSHEQARVRQTALYILGQRLDRMTKGRRPSTEERVLFLELATQLRKSICEAHPNAGAGVDNSSGGGGSAKKAAPAARARSRSRSSSLASMDSEGQATADLTQSRESRITLAQSALMCLDSLTRHIGKARDWTEPLTEALGELTELATALLASINNAPVDGAEAEEESGNKKKRRGSSLGDASAASSIKSSASAAAAASLVNHELKLAASLFLCCGTIVKAIGPRALAQLGPLMDAMLQLTERQTKVIKALGPSLLAANDEDEDEEDEDDNGDDDKGDDSDKEEGEKTASVKASALLLRSVLASLVSVVSEVPSFAHPYLRRVLLTSLSLREVAATRNPVGVPAGRALAPWLLNTLSVLVGDVDQCLSTVAQQIPPRLSIPAFRAAAPSLLGFGHSGAARLALLLGEVWAALDRPAILASMGDNGALCALLLDYRRVHGSGDGDVVQGAAAVEEASCEAIVTLCLKLTEGELKALLARLAEWRDSASVSTTGDGTGSVGASGTGNASRGVAFYRLMAALGERLQALFCPSMGPYWGHVIDTLGALSGGGVGGGENNSSTSTSSKNKGGKKRKSAGGEVASPSNALWQREQVQLAQQALEAVRVCCTHDSNDFVDEERYNAMMPAVVGLLPITLYCNGDGGDDQYSVFVKGSLAPCLVALALSVGKDTLWKPLTHHVLMATRHTRSAVRLAALHTLHTLFMEVGEEFLVLLPECLPFLSELMEDDSSDVCDCTSKVVRYIEELSGEKLDQYLQ